MKWCGVGTHDTQKGPDVSKGDNDIIYNVICQLIIREMLKKVQLKLRWE